MDVTLRRRSFRPIGNQRGAVLIVALLVLLVLTILGVTGLSSMTLEERMAANYQQMEISFQGSESAINQVIVSGSKHVFDLSENDWVARSDYDLNTDPFETLAKTSGCNATYDLGGPVEIDTTNAITGATIETDVTMEYRGSVPPGKYLPGFEMGGDAFSVEITTITATTHYMVSGMETATSSQTQRVKRAGPGGSGCPLPEDEI